MRRQFLAIATLVAAHLAAVAPAASQQVGPPLATSVAQSTFFYVGGQYVGEPDKEVMAGQMYVERLAPREVRRESWSLFSGFPSCWRFRKPRITRPTTIARLPT